MLGKSRTRKKTYIGGFFSAIEYMALKEEKEKRKEEENES